MSELDEGIAGAPARGESADRPDPDREDTLRDLLAASFRGKTGWMAVVACVYILLFAAVAVFALQARRRRQ